MATTDLHKYTVAEKLNKMDVDVITISCAMDTEDDGVITSGDVLFVLTEIPNAVSVAGGTAILQSITGINDKQKLGAYDVIITNDSTALTHGGTNTSGIHEAANAITNVIGVMDGTQGIVSVNAGTDVGVASISSTGGIGLTCKAAAGSTSLYAWGIGISTDDPDEGTLYLKLGFIKD